MIDFAYYNGEILPYGELKIPLSDRSIFFGDGVYDVMIGEGRRVYQFSRHIDRLFYSARHIGIERLPERAELCRAVAILTELAGRGRFLLYVQLSRFCDGRSHLYPADAQTNLLITIREHNPPPSGAPIKLITRPDLRYKLCHLKTLNLLPSVLAANEAARLGADEAVLVRDGTVTECSHSSILILTDGVILTHPLTEAILPGITRANLLAACSALGIPARELAFTVSQLRCADEIFVTSTTTLARRACMIDGKSCGMRDEKTAARLIEYLKNDYIASIRQY
ncbi:MAG: aminotransferase class IV [Clostridia bacterium]|nr:aminotransferase class IV [Clostridia bacterium]